MICFFPQADELLYQKFVKGLTKTKVHFGSRPGAQMAKSPRQTALFRHGEPAFGSIEAA